MGRNSRKSKGKQINPTFFVFCEGETEEAYISYLRSKYRLPIVIDAKIAGHHITEKYISSYKTGKDVHPKDRNYLLYDLDVPEILPRLQTIKGAVLLLSNPCFEFWYLLHFQDHKSYLSTEECERKLLSHHKNYKKGLFDNKLKDKLDEKQDKAVHRASKLTQHENPSSQIFQLINDLEEIQRNRDL